ncbi:hypothetical protein RUM44_005540 [Polyplax serrata]|uniref:Phosphatidic acid phosphatase type 2/haloperoxidase domain-containing protein n=1 Tax=Polyplax serrata TaxID=468196 RepID=A0ABR1ADP3_POLSC
MNAEQDFKQIVTRIIIDIVSLLAVGLPILIFFLVGKPYERGFYCDDESLRHPYLESTVPSWLLYVVGLGLPIAIIIIVEYSIHKRSCTTKRKIRLLFMKVPSWMWECYRHVGVFGFGAACSQLTTDVAKYTIGRLRPHFFDVCKPDVDCSDPKYKYNYIEKFRCQQTNERLLKEMRLSFPSGHSSFSAYCMIFIIMYIQVRFTWRGSKLLKHVLQYICLTLAFYTALSRISDYKHHWSDVLAGSLQGIIVAVLIVVYVSDLLDKPESNAAKESPVIDGMNMEDAMQMR